ncbi:PspC domain-containing protein [Lysinimonas soli]|uniref:PspC domain-containing protein n=1 Tax=Lysinimonas soli TaxID=1074233 RepID=A0ABW0NPX8_9MICO
MTTSTFVRPIRGRVIAGVCAAIANHYGWDVGGVRAGMLVLILFSGIGLVLYLALWLAIPSEW